MKQAAKVTLCALYKYSGAMHAQELAARLAGRSHLSVLLFHRVTDEIAEDGLTVSTSWFERFCRLMRRSFRVVPLAEVHRLLESGTALPPRTVAITFDDCYADNLQAARVLAEHGLPACFFLPTAYVGSDHRFAWDSHLKPLANLTWDQVREMSRLGHDFGSHTATHANMALIDVDQARQELLDSRRKLEDELGRPARWFAYPFGGKDDFLDERLALVRETGYDACFSGFGGFVSPKDAKGVLPREPMPNFRSLLNLELHLRGCLRWFYTLKRGLRGNPAALRGLPSPEKSDLYVFHHS